MNGYSLIFMVVLIFALALSAGVLSWCLTRALGELVASMAVQGRSQRLSNLRMVMLLLPALCCMCCAEDLKQWTA